jgi:hypothetical protein
MPTAFVFLIIQQAHTQLHPACSACAAVSDAGTDCALGEIFTCEIPPGVEKFQIEVVAKHTLTGDDYIGAATLSLLQVWCYCCCCCC